MLVYDVHSWSLYALLLHPLDYSPKFEKKKEMKSMKRASIDHVVVVLVIVGLLVQTVTSARHITRSGALNYHSTVQLKWIKLW